MSSHWRNPNLWSLILLVVSAGLLAGLGALYTVIPEPLPATFTALPPAQVAVIVPPTATPTPSVTPTPTASLTPTPAPATPTATFFYVVQANQPPAATPVLPASAPFPTSCDGPGRITILVAGIDGYTPGPDYNRPARTDSIMLVGVNVANRSAAMLSIPRDLWVPLPDGTTNRINLAYRNGELAGTGGPQALATTLASLLGVGIDRYLIINYSAFEQGVDAIGGITVNVPEAIRDSAYPMRSREGTMVVEFPAGPVQLNGADALIYARIRHDSSDFKRMQRQQQVLFAIRDKLMRPETVLQWPALTQLMLSSVRTNLSFEDIALLGCVGAQINRQSIQSWTLNTRMAVPTTLESGASVLLPNLEAIAPVVQAFSAGE